MSELNPKILELSKKITDLEEQVKNAKNELEKANAEFRQVTYQTNSEIINAFQKSPDLFKVLLPQHSCSSCKKDDEKRENAYLDHGVPRCMRCYLLEMFHNIDSVEADKFIIRLDCLATYR